MQPGHLRQVVAPFQCVKLQVPACTMYLPRNDGICSSTGGLSLECVNVYDIFVPLIYTLDMTGSIMVR